MATVRFTGSSCEDIENAKAFWRVIDPPPKLLSTLTVSGVDHRLPKVPNPPQNGAYSFIAWLNGWSQLMLFRFFVFFSDSTCTPETSNDEGRRERPR